MPNTIIMMAGTGIKAEEKKWRPLGGSNPCCRRERAES
jgi:hypothetical protein